MRASKATQPIQSGRSKKKSSFPCFYCCYSYIAVMPGIMPRRNQLFHFNGGDVEEHFNALSLFRGLTYKAKGRTMLLVPDRFRKSVDLFDMLHAADSKKYQFDPKK